MNVWFHSNQNDWEDGVIKHLKEKKIWKNVYNTNWEKPENEYANINYLQNLDSTESLYLPNDLYNEIYPYLYVFIDMYSRNNKNDQNSYNNLNIHGYLNLFNIILQYYYYQYIKNKISLVFFNRAPHVGFDYISYILAKKMGIKTLILEQSHFENRFFYYWDHLDYGNFNSSKVKFEHPYFEIKKGFKKDLIYMKNVNKKNFKTRREVYYHFPVIRFFRELFDEELRVGAVNKLYKTIEYRKMSKLHEIPEDDINFNIPFIYFGLHLQPEKTTSSWGGIYNDQILAIENLSQKLPDGWKIYVKENPKQGYFMRDKFFYQRLNKIPNTIVVDNKTNTYKLLKNCKIAATITGTIGWECVTGGKPAIYFGWGTWYKSFPGVYEFNEDIDLKEIVSNFKELNKNEIENRLNKILDFTGKGVIYNKSWYKDLVNEYDTEENIFNIATSLTKILKS